MNRKWMYVTMIAASLTWVACDDDDDKGETRISDTDQTFIENAAMSNMAEVDLGELASTRATDSLVKAYASMMVAEHTAAQNELRSIFERHEDDNENLDWPEELSPTHQAMRSQFEMLQGYEFDSAYIASQVTAHQQAQQIFQTEVNGGTDPATKGYANKYLPHINEHLEHADSIQTVIMENNMNNNNGEGNGDGMGTGDGTGTGG